MIVSLHGALLDHAGLLEQVRLHVAALDVVLLVAVHFHVLPESRRVVVAHGLGVTEALEQWVRVQDLVLNARAYAAGRAATHSGDELQDLLRGFRLSSSRFT